MGWTAETWHLTAHVDSHGGERQRASEELWEEMQQKLNAIRDDPRYEPLSPM